MTINKDETLIYWTVCVENIRILKVIFGLGKLASASASASWFWPRPRPRPRRFVLGLGLENLSSFNITGIFSRKHENCRFCACTVRNIARNQLKCCKVAKISLLEIDVADNNACMVTKKFRSKRGKMQCLRMHKDTS